MTLKFLQYIRLAGSLLVEVLAILQQNISLRLFNLVNVTELLTLYHRRQRMFCGLV